MWRTLLLLLVVFLFGFAFARPVLAQQTQVQMEQVRVDFTFGEQILGRGVLKSDIDFNQVGVFMRAEGSANTIGVPASLGADNEIVFVHNLQAISLRPFARVIFWFQFTLANGDIAYSPEYTFDYRDNRFNWQTREEGNLRIHWYAGDAKFGQNAIDAARGGLGRITNLLPVSLGRPVDIYIYTNSEDLRGTLQQFGSEWVGGHASPDLYLAFVSIPPGYEQALAMERKIPHELAHILTYELARERYSLLPIWLREGIASVSEIYTSPDYQRSLSVALENKTLLSFTTLCRDFPADASSRFLAYAQSESFTRYIVDEYGISGLNQLILAYGDGLGCEQGTQRALGISLTQLEYAWRSERLGENRVEVAFQNLSAYWVVFGIILTLPLFPAFFVRKPKDE